MSLSASTVWEIRTAGSDTNGGGFVAGASGTDYSQQNTKNTVGNDISTTDAVANGTTTITSATANFGTTIIGNIIYLQGGTGGLAAGWYQVTARASTSSITVDRAVAAGTGITMNIGGALASLGMVGVPLVSNNYVWVKSGTYTVTSASGNVSGGCLNMNLVTAYIEGYNTTRGDMGTRPLIQTDGVITNFTFISQSTNGFQYIRNINFDGNSRAVSRATAIRGFIMYCKFSNFTNSGAAGGSLIFPVAFQCSATGCTTASPFTDMSCYECSAYSNTITGFTCGGSDCMFVRCVSASNTGGTTNGFSCGSAGIKSTCINCVAYANGQHGFWMGGQRCNFVINCIAEANVGTGFIHNGNNQIGLYNCAYYNNGTNVTLGTNSGSSNVGGITGSGSFFTNAAAGDFTLNNTAGAGGSVRGAGLGTVPDLTGSQFIDLGAYQSQNSSGPSGGGSFVFF